MKRLKKTLHLEEFSRLYMSASGLPVSISFLEQSKVYGFFLKGKLVGGFSVNCNADKRTIESFSSDIFKKVLSDCLSDSVEMCCFWIDEKVRRNKLFNYYCWIGMALVFSMQRQPIAIWGTNSRGLACIYNSSKRSLCVHVDRVKNSDTFIFKSRTKQVLFGILHVLRRRSAGRSLHKHLPSIS